MKAIARQGVVWALLAMLALPVVVHAQVDIGTDPADPPTIIFGPPGETISSPPTNFQGPARYTYTDNGDGTCTITGYAGSGGDISIPSTINGLTVTSIGNCAFEASSVTSVVIPNSVTNIESSPSWVYDPGGPYIPVTAGAFACCDCLTNVVILSSTLNIGDGAFLECFNLTSIYFACNAPSIGLHVFDWDRSSLTVYYLPWTIGWTNLTVNYLPDGSNWGDPLTTLSIAQWNPDGFVYSLNSDSTLTISGYTGSGGGIAIPSAFDNLPITSIGNEAFCFCASLTSVVIDNGVTNIGGGAFCWCTSLTNVVIGNGITSIGDSAFQFCGSLTSVGIPSSVTSIGNGAFDCCGSLESVCFSGNAPVLGIDVLNNPPLENNVFFDSPCVVYYQLGTMGWTEPTWGGVLCAQGQQAGFNYYSPDGTNMTVAGRYCGPGGDVVIPSVINGLPVTAICDSTFMGCSSLTSVIIPNGVTNIGDYTFYNCSSLTSITIPNSVASIGDWAFYGCSGLPSVVIPNGVSYIGDDAFDYCSSLTNVPIPNSVTSIGVAAFANCCSLTNVVIGSGVTNIENAAFCWCSSLTSITIPNSVISIGVAAFRRCSSLTNVVISSGVINIGDYAFSYCTSLASVCFSGSASALGNDVFDDSHGDFDPATVYYLPNTTGWGATYGGLPTVPVGYAWLDNGDGTCTITGYSGSGGVVSIPSTINGLPVTSFADNDFDYQSAFSNCTSITIPNSVTSIGSYAFEGCFYLSSIYFIGNAPSLGSDVFDNDTATIYYLSGTTGWSSTFGGLPTVLWNPQMLNDATFGAQTNCFGFTITNAGNPTVVIEACTNLNNPVWIPVSTNTLTGGASYFSDSQWTNYPTRYYRLASPW